MFKQKKYQQVTALAIEMLPDKENRFHLITLKKERDSIVIEKQIESAKSLNAALKNLKKHSAIVLCLYGKGVAGRNIFFGTEIDKTIWIQKILPGSNIDDFYWQKVVSLNNEAEAYINIIRLDLLNNWLKKIKDYSLFVTDVFLDIQTLPVLLPLLVQEEPSFVYYGHSKVEVFQKNIIRVEKGNQERKTHNIGEESIAAVALPAFGAAFATMLNSQKWKAPEHIERQREAFKYKQLFSRLSKMVLGFFFTLLLINFLLFNSFFQENNRLNSELTTKQGQINRLKKMEAKIAFNKKLHEESGGWHYTKVSFYADRLAAVLPQDFHLEELYIHPIREDNKRTKNKRPLYELDNIRLNGYCSKGGTLNDWLKELRKEKWIKDIQVLQYSEAIDDAFFKLNIVLQ